MTIERWAPVRGLEGNYEVSDHGRIRNTKTGRILKTPLSCGYPRFYPSVGRNKSTVLVHRAMAEAFIPNPEGKPFINHKDGDKANCSLGNLEWCTHAENMAHAFKNGLATASHLDSGPGEASPAAKLTEQAVRDIKRRISNREPERKIAAAFGVSQGTVGHIKHGRTWRHV